LNDGVEMELPIEYIKAKTTKDVSQVNIQELGAMMEKFLNFHDRQFDVGAAYDTQNLHRRRSWDVLFDSKIDAGSHLKVGLIVILNKDLCMFEVKLKIQCGQRVLLIKNIYDFMRMFDFSFKELEKSYGSHIVFEDLIGRVVYDVNGDTPWLALYQIQDYYYHKIGVEDEPIRIVFSQREFKALFTFMKHQMHMVMADMSYLCHMANSYLREILYKVQSDIKHNCKGCQSNQVIQHTCDEIYLSHGLAEKALLKQFAATKADQMNLDECRKHVLESLETLVEPITSYLVKSTRGRTAIAFRFNGGLPLYILPYETPDQMDICAMYGPLDTHVVCDCCDSA
jgi:hypothetical protein